MIVVVEGISASGKTSWCAKHGDGQIIAENGELEDVQTARPIRPVRRAFGQRATWIAGTPRSR